eukprot:c18523_g1_i1 orf=340-1248(+)
MKPIVDELSDDDCETVNVRVSRVLGPRLSSSGMAKDSSGVRSDINGSSPSENGAKALPSLDSFAFRSKGKAPAMVQDFPDDDGSPMFTSGRKRKARKYVVMDESSDEDFDPMQQKYKEARTETMDPHSSAPKTLASELSDASHNGNTSTWNDGSITNGSISNDEAIARLLQEEEELASGMPSHEDSATLHEEVQLVDLESQEPEVDLIGNTLQKCDEIAASLRKELKVGGSSDSAECVDRYAEVDASAAKIVSQADVSAACRSADSDHLVLKPYQLVGVNFLMLLHRKNVGGAILADEMGLG